MAVNIPLCDFDKSVIQLLLSQGIMREEKFRDALFRLEQDFPDPHNNSSVSFANNPANNNETTKLVRKRIESLLQRITRNISAFGLEARR